MAARLAKVSILISIESSIGYHARAELKTLTDCKDLGPTAKLQATLVYEKATHTILFLRLKNGKTLPIKWKLSQAERDGWAHCIKYKCLRPRLEFYYSDDFNVSPFGGDKSSAVSFDPREAVDDREALLQQQALAFAMAVHRRLGATAEARHLGSDLIGDITRLVMQSPSQ